MERDDWSVHFDDLDGTDWADHMWPEEPDDGWTADDEDDEDDEHYEDYQEYEGCEDQEIGGPADGWSSEEWSTSSGGP